MDQRKGYTGEGEEKIRKFLWGEGKRKIFQARIGEEETSKRVQEVIEILEEGRVEEACEETLGLMHELCGHRGETCRGFKNGNY